MNKNVDITLRKCNIVTNIMSNLILYIFGLKHKMPLFQVYQDQINIINEKNNENNNIKDNNDNLKIINKIDYRKIFNEILNEFIVRIKFFGIIVYANKLIITLSFNKNKIYTNKEKNIINLTFENWNFEINSSKTNYKNKKFGENNKQTKIIYDITTNLIKGEAISIYLYTNLIEIFHLWDNISFLFEKNSKEVFKYDFNIDDIILYSDQFIYTVSKMYIKNFEKDIVIENTFYFKLLEFNLLNKKKNI